MTYEEKYNQALERAKCYTDSRCSDNTKSIVTAIFPELKESEDEKIKKEIILFFEREMPQCSIEDHKEYMRKWISWLEKQGEQKPTKNIMNVWKEMRFEVLVQAVGSNLNKLASSDENAKIFSLSDIDEIFEKISDATIEQKPACSNADEFPYNNPSDTLEGEIENIWEKLSCDNLFTATKEGFEEVIRHFVNWLEKQGEQKPLWSEEEEARIDRIINILDWAEEKGHISYSNWEDYITYVKSLKPQNKQNTAWNEEDEKMMNQLHSWMKEFGGAEEYTEKVYNWLQGLIEKQGKKKEIDYNEELKKCKANPLYFFDKYVKVKFKEQKPTNKFEPKFKIGDWVVQRGIGNYKIVEVCESWYEVISYKDGKQYSIGFDKENNCHLWNITQDAKDGDVLYECNEEKPFIFKELKTKHIDDISSYCDIFNGIFNPNEDNWTTLDIVPATKEQRDKLEKAIMEAGYEWNPEKKELKKIDNKWVDLGLPSGTLWKSFNEIGFFTYDEAVNDFGDKLPTKEQFEELKAKCNWEWKGNGCKVKGPNGNYIFMPAAGYRYGKDIIAKLGTFGYYWSLTPDDSDNAWALYIYSTEEGMYNNYRSYGQSVRLVKNKQ